MKAWFFLCIVITLALSYLALIGTITLPHSEPVPGIGQPMYFFPDYSVPIVLLYIALVAGYCYVSYIGIREYSETTGNDGITPVPILFALGFGFYGIGAWLLTFTFFAVTHLIEVVEADDVGVATMIFGALSVLVLSLFYVVFQFVFLLFQYILAVPITIFSSIVLIPYFCIGVYSFNVGASKEVAVAEKIVRSKRPNSDLEVELAEAMMSGVKSDAELMAIIGEMSSTRKFFHKMTYRRKAEKYREISRVMREQMKAKEARADMGRTAHEHERARRQQD